MKKIIGIIIYVVFIIFLFNIDAFSNVEDVTYYSDAKVKNLKNINIDASNVEVDIIASPFEEIAVTRKTSKKKSEEISYSSNYTNNTLTVKQFKKSEIDNKFKDKLYIQIPQESSLSNLNININDGKITFDGVVSKQTNLKSNNNLNLLIENSNFDDLSISSLEINSSLKNTIVTDKLSYKVNGGNINNLNVTGGEEIIDSIDELNYFNESSFFNKTKFLGDAVNVSFALSNNKNYYFTNVKNKLSENFLEESGTDYKYFKDDKTIKKYLIDINDNKVVSIKESVDEEF